jgi:small subunit ribosomal protein S17
MEVKHKTIVGRVVSNRMKKTVVVAVESPKRHLIYKKTMRRVTNFKAHDEKNECKVGDVVRIMECRPLSKDKRWLVTGIVTRGNLAELQPKDIA